jgi:arsenite methyltransferase
LARKVRKSSGSDREDEVRRSVREHYKELAVRQAPCCSPSGQASCGCGGLYSETETSSIPSESLSVSAGCGNPTAIAELKEGMVVVDLGSGGGIDAFISAKKVGPKGKVYGIDATHEMILRARKTARDNGFDNVEFRLGEIEHMPLPDGCADVVISNCVINLSPEKQLVFDEAFRVLRPGGKLAVSDIVLLRELPDSLKGDMAAWSACVSGAVLEREYLAAIESAGFEEVKVEDRVVYTDEHMRALVSPQSLVFRSGSDGGDYSDLVASCRVTAVKPR